MGSCDEGLIWNPNNCDCEFDKSYDVGEYLDYKNCKCRNKLVDKLVEECIENIDGNEMSYNKTLNEKYATLVEYIFYYLLLIISLSISSFLIYFYWYLKRRYIEATIY